MEERLARNWYWWLWLSPLMTLPCLNTILGYPEDPPQPAVAILGSSLCHLILLVPALHKRSAFVRWHGRQALLLAGVRTLVPLVFVLAFGLSGGFELLAVPILIVVWFFGTLLGQLQAAQGNCSLMRWFGLAEAQPSRLRAREAARKAEAEAEAEALVDVIRHSRDRKARDKALAELQELGMVESL